MAKIKITKEQAIMLENLKKNKVIKITESQYKKLVESLNPGQEIDKEFERAIPVSARQEFKSNRNKLDEGLWESFINELYGINESSEKVYESLIKIMEACGYVENKKLSKAKFGGDKKMAKDVILGGLQTLDETGSPFMAMEAMEDEFERTRQHIKQQLIQIPKTKPTPEEIAIKLTQLKKAEEERRKASGEIKEIDGEEDAPNKMVPINPESEDAVDTITMDVPLFIRALEYSREDAQSDLDLHTIAQNAVVLNKEYGMLNMDNYGEIFGDAEEVEPEPAGEELNELEVDDLCGDTEQAIGKKILNYEPFKSLPDTRAEVKSMGASLVSLPSLDTGGATIVIFSKEDLFDHSFEYNGKEYNTSGYIDEFKRKYGEEPIFCNIQINTDRNISNAKIVNMPGMKSLDPRGQGPLDEKEIDEVTAMGGSGGVFGGDGVNPKSGGSTFPVAPLQKNNESKIYEALGALKKK